MRLTVSSNSDAAKGLNLERQVSEAIAEGHLEVVVELPASDRLAPPTVQALLNAARAMRTRGGRLLVGCRAARQRRIFEVTGLDRHVELIHLPR